MSNYDGHIIATQLGYDANSITVIPNSEEKYISFSKYITNKFSIRFVDSLRFMPNSLAELASNLTNANKYKFRETLKHFSITDIDLVTRKGVFPYDYVDSWNKLNETKLPPIDDFYSILTASTISNEDYEHAQHMWSHFNIKSLGEYSDYYLKVDVLILSDIFENFRDLCLKTYGVDSAFYYTAPGMSFDAMLKHTCVELELLHDYDMILFCERGVRGGITQAVQRYSKANNVHVPGYDMNKLDTWINYLDATNL